MLKKEPAVVLGLLAAVIAAVMQAIDAAQAGGSFNVWTAILVGLPLLTGIAVRANVVASETLRSILDRADTGIAAARELNERVKAQNPPTS